MMTPQQSLHQYLSAHHAYGQAVNNLGIVAPESETEFEMRISELRGAWLTLKARETQHFANEADPITII